MAAPHRRRLLITALACPLGLWSITALGADAPDAGQPESSSPAPETPTAPAAPESAAPASPAPETPATEAPAAGTATQAAEPAAAQGPWAACADCHEEVVTAFKKTPHAKARFFGVQATCESCHPGGAEHAASGGNRKKVTNPAKVDAEKASEPCLRCHEKERHLTWWRGSSHEENQVACSNCHSVHHGAADKLLATSTETSLCYGCHLNVRADVLKRSRHPLRDSAMPTGEGKMTCSSCHNPHGGRSRALIDATSVNDQCYRCHFEKKAPVLWEHSPVKEDCLICHNAHGSSNDKLLVSRVPRLCQECHMQGRHQSGTLAPNSVFAINRSCLNCHPQVHGSNNPSGTVLQR